MSIVDDIRALHEELRLAKADLAQARRDLEEERRSLNTLLPGITKERLRLQYVQRPDLDAMQFKVGVEMPRVQLLVPNADLYLARYPADVLAHAARRMAAHYTDAVALSVASAMQASPEIQKVINR